MNNKKFLNFFKNNLKLVSGLSTCYKYKVGAIIVKDGRIISTGYNGTPSDIPECKEFYNILKRLYKILKNNPNITKNNMDNFIIEKLNKKNKNYIKNEKLIDFLKSKTKKIYKNKDLKNIKDENDFASQFNFFHSDNSILGEIHAEQNAIVFAAKYGYSVKDCSLYSYYLPCMTCAKQIKQAGIKEVYYVNEYINHDGSTTYDFFHINGIKLIKLDE